jgi:predicted lipoprotein with Yx(FWY)xxD motif
MLKTMKKKFISPVYLILGFVAVCAILNSCKKSSNTVNSYSVNIASSATLGQHLVDKDGYTLYIFSNDYKGRNRCSGGCETLWPYFYAGTLTQSSLGMGLDINDFDTINVGGTPQTRYKGWPLYYYAPSSSGYYGTQNVREAAGQTGGDAYANVWFVAKPDYTIMLANGQLVGMDGKNYTSNYVTGTGNTEYFTDAAGSTLYTFSLDSADHNKFTSSDFSNNIYWPIYDTTSITVPSILDKTLFTVITVYGRKQLAYKGWPLYYFGADDKVKGNTKGVSVPTPGFWPVAVKDIGTAP